MNLDDPTEVIRFALLWVHDSRWVDLHVHAAWADPNAAGIDPQRLQEACMALADDPTLGGLVTHSPGERRDTPDGCQGAAEAQIGVQARAHVYDLMRRGIITRESWPPPRPGTHESQCRCSWGPCVLELPGTYGDGFYEARGWSMANATTNAEEAQ